MKKWLVPAAVGALTLAAGSAAMAQPYGYYGGYHDGYRSYGYGGHRSYRRDSDRDGIPDRAEWGRDRDRDGRPDQWDRHDNRRWRHHHSYRYSRPYYGYDRGYYGYYRY
jgi:hypothetical protein